MNKWKSMKCFLAIVLCFWLYGCGGGGSSINYHTDPLWPVQKIIKGGYANTEYDHHDLKTHIEADKALGVSIVNSGVPWFVIEPQQGSYNLAWTDQYVNQYKAAGIDFIMCISSSPKWANGSDDPFYIPQDEAQFSEWLSKYRNYITFIVNHLKDRVHVWRLWNEANMDRFFRGMRSDQYCRFAFMAYYAIKNVDPNATVLWGSGVTSSKTEAKDRKLGSRFFREIVACAPPDVDNFDIHAYGDGDEVMIFRNVLDKAGRKSAKFWITEFGKNAGDAEQLAWYKSFLGKVKKYGFGIAEMTAFIDAQWPGDMIDTGNTDPNIKPYGLVKVNDDGTMFLRPAGAYYRDFQF